MIEFVGARSPHELCASAYLCAHPFVFHCFWSTYLTCWDAAVKSGFVHGYLCKITSPWFSLLQMGFPNVIRVRPLQNIFVAHATESPFIFVHIHIEERQAEESFTCWASVAVHRHTDTQTRARQYLYTAAVSWIEKISYARISTPTHAHRASQLFNLLHRTLCLVRSNDASFFNCCWCILFVFVRKRNV